MHGSRPRNLAYDMAFRKPRKGTGNRMVRSTSLRSGLKSWDLHTTALIRRCDIAFLAADVTSVKLKCRAGTLLRVEKTQHATIEIAIISWLPQKRRHESRL